MGFYSDLLGTNNSLFGIKCPNKSNFLNFTPGSNLTASRALTFTTGDAARTITINGNPTLDDWFDQAVKAASSPTFAAIKLTTGASAGKFLMSDADGDASWNTIAGGSRDITQAGHGLSVGNAVYYNGSAYAKAKADASSTAEVVGIVSAVDGDNFTLTYSGYISTLSGLTAGSVYYLSDATAGLLTTTAPTTEGYVNKPVFIAVSTTAGYFFNFRGVIIGLNPSYYTSFTNASLTAGVLTVTHNLGHKYCTVTVTNNSDQVVIPDEITLTNTTTLSVDLTSYGTISGTWHVMVLDIGGSVTSAYDQNLNTTDSPTFNALYLKAGTTKGLFLESLGTGKYLRPVSYSTLTADRYLYFTTGDSDRVITLNGNTTLNDWFDQEVKSTSSPVFSGLSGVAVGGADLLLENSTGIASLVSGNYIGRIFFNGGSYNMAAIYGAVDGTPGVGDLPSRITFLTCADGSSTLTERMRICANGRIGFGVTPNYRFEVRGEGTSSATYTIVCRNTTPATTFCVDDAGAGYVLGNCDADSYTGHCKYPDSLELAYDVINSFSGQNGKADHTKIHSFVQGTKQWEDREDRGIEVMSTLACLAEVMKDVTSRLDKLEKK